jgi:hypothetical protein
MVSATAIAIAVAIIPRVKNSKKNLEIPKTIITMAMATACK